MSILDKILRAGEGKKLKALEGIVPDINALGDELRRMSDEDLKAKTPSSVSASPTALRSTTS